MPTSLAGVTNSGVKIGLRVRGYSTGSQSLSVNTVDNLVAGIRARCQATLPEATRFPEALNNAVNMAQSGLLPLLAIVVQKGQDVSTSWAVFDVAQIIPCDLVFAVITGSTGTTDSAQDLRVRLGVLQSAFMQDRRLNGLVTQTTTRNVPEAKVNEYEQLFAAEGQLITCMVLGLDFTVVQSVLPNV